MLLRKITIFVFMLLMSNVRGQIYADYNTAGNHTFTVPCGVSSITIQCWGGGGSGGGGLRGGGGGGGAFALKTISVTPGTVYNLTVGAGGTISTGNGVAGGTTTFNTNTVIAVGGNPGISGNPGAGGTGGSSASCTGTTVYSGGNGAAGTTNNSGGGGGGADNLSGGNNASGTTGGTGGSTTGVPGGNGAAGFTSNSHGASGNYYAGGGSGGRGSGYYGGYGSVGRVVITYTVTPPAASITNSPASLCNGGNAVIGGNVTAIGSWTLTLSDGTAVTGTGSGAWSTTVTPSVTTTYTISSLVNGSCNATAGNLTGSVTITVAGFPTNVSGATTSSCTLQSENHWIYFTNGGLALTALTDYTAGGHLGATNVQVYTHPSVLSYNGTKYMQRVTAITPAANAPSRVRLYFTETDFQNLKNSDPAYASKTYSDLRVTKFPGNVSTPSGTPVLMTSVSVTNTIHGWTNRHALEFDNSSYSTFFIHFGNTTSPLPVQLTNFAVHCDPQDVQLNWATASESNSQLFIAEKSRDLVYWNFVGELPAAGNSNIHLDYSMTDPELLDGIVYYRLLQVDIDGVVKTYGPISIACVDESHEMTIFPNPSEGTFTVEISSMEKIVDGEIRIVDAAGKLVAKRVIDLVDGKNQALFEGLDIQSGVYFVQLISAQKQIDPVKLVIRR